MCKLNSSGWLAILQRGDGRPGVVRHLEYTRFRCSDFDAAAMPGAADEESQRHHATTQKLAAAAILVREVRLPAGKVAIASLLGIGPKERRLLCTKHS